MNFMDEHLQTLPKKSSDLSVTVKLTPIRILLAGFLAGILLVALPVGFLAYYRGAAKASNGQQAVNNPPTGGQNAPTPEQPPAQVDFKITSSDHIRGAKNAKVTLVEFSDFECSFCGRHTPTLDKILKDYAGKVRLVFKHFPLSFHQYATKAANATECASEQGKFWEMHDKIFTGQDKLSNTIFSTWAKELGLNVGKFDSCLSSTKYQERISADMQLASQSGVDGTQATFVNGKLVSGAQPYESFKALIDAALKQ